MTQERPTIHEVAYADDPSLVSYRSGSMVHLLYAPRRTALQDTIDILNVSKLYTYRLLSIFICIIWSSLATGSDLDCVVFFDNPKSTVMSPGAWLSLHNCDLTYVKLDSTTPMFELNFYLMGKKEVDQQVILEIGKNIDYLNQELEGLIHFRLGQLVMDPNQAYIPDLHQAHNYRQSSVIDDLIDPVELSGGIHVYLFDTYSKDDGNSAMLGFTPILKAQHSKYKDASPRFDRLYISYAGLTDQSTLVHEMGHFFGLSHPWELDNLSYHMMGHNSTDATRNHMSYHPEVNHFTAEQLDRMQHFAIQFRSYLIKKMISEVDQS